MDKQIARLNLYRVTSNQNNKQLFNNISSSVPAGSLLYIQGPNGSGKTTLLKIITNILMPAKGSVYIGDEWAKKKHIVNYISFMKSNPVFDEEQVVLDYLIYWTYLYNGVNRLSYEHIYKVLDRIGLGHERYHKISYLSLGQRKRLQIGLCLLINKPIWVMDEPTIGLDRYWVEQLSIIMEEKCYRGGIILLTTHTHLDIKNTNTYILHIDE